LLRQLCFRRTDADKQNQHGLRSKRDICAIRSRHASGDVAARLYRLAKSPLGCGRFRRAPAGRHQRYRANGSSERYYETVLRRFATRNLLRQPLNRIPGAESPKFFALVRLLHAKTRLGTNDRKSALAE
jgi:hypothetical protein